MPDKWILCLLFLLMVLVPIHLYAQEQEKAVQEEGKPTTDSLGKKAPMILEKLVEIMEEKKEKKASLNLMIDGLVIDETRTKMGRDFYELFLTNWEMPKGAHNFNFIIRELPGRATTSFVTVEVNDHEVLKLTLQPRYDIIEEMAKYAVARCYEYITNYEQIQKDLSSGDLSGSGIY